jgi:hypothetical protein
VRSLVNVTRGEARHRAEVGAALFTDPVAAALAETRAAALSGQVSSRHVSAIAAAVVRLSPPSTPVEVVDQDTRRDAQRVLAGQAAVLDPTQTTVLAKRTLAVLDPDAGDRLARDEDLRDLQRGLTFTPDGTGLVQVRGALTPVCAGLLATARACQMVCVSGRSFRKDHHGRCDQWDWRDEEDGYCRSAG